MGNITSEKELPAIRREAQKEAMLAQLRRIPIVQVACEKAGVSRAQFYRLREEPEFRAHVEEAITEDLNSVRTHEGREKTFHYLQSEIIPLGGPDTKLIVAGNLLHPDSSIMRLRTAIEEKRIEGVFRMYPLQDDDLRITWPERFTPEILEKEKKKYADEIDWEREMNLRFVSAPDEVVREEWISRYDKLPHSEYAREFVIGVDPAISQKQTAHYTAIVTTLVCNSGDQTKLYVLPNPVNKRMTFPDTVDEIRRLYESLGKGFWPVRILVEDIAYQRALVEHLQTSGLPVKGHHIGMDKRAKFSILGHLFKNERILLPKSGCEHLVQQAVGFGRELHNDLPDALALIAFATIPNTLKEFKFPSNFAYPGMEESAKPDDAAMRALLSDPEQLKKLEREADLNLIEEQLEAKGIRFGRGKRDRDKGTSGNGKWVF